MTDSVLTDYVALLPNTETLEQFTNWLMTQGITKQKHQGTHITIIYSETRCDLAGLFGWTSAEDIFETKLSLPTPVVIKPKDIKGWEKFGKESQYLVLLVKHPTLFHMNRNCQNMGGTMSFPDYQPHITVDEVVGDIDISELDIPDFDLVFTECQVQREYMVSDM